MTQPSLALDAASLSPIALFLQADIVVKAVMIGLLLASVAVWVVILVSGWQLRRARRETERFERDFWKASDVEGFAKEAGGRDVAAARVLQAGLAEWKRSTARGVVDRAGVRERLLGALDSATAHEVDQLGERLNLLATVGSVAPFVGLFGTVWGIMRSFAAIAGAKESSLAVVAPGIAEALFATAIGLFAAIPAVIAYNRFLHALGRIESRLGRFVDGFHAMMSRELERG